MDPLKDLQEVEAKVIPSRADGAARAMPGARAEARALDRPGLRPVEVMLAAYLVITTVVLVLKGGHVHKLGLLLATRLALGLLLALSATGRFPSALKWIRDWYPIMISPLFYTEAGLLNRAFTSGYFDVSVTGWENWIFGGQPSVDLRDWAPQALLSEYLHLAYFSYYFLVPSLGLVLYLSKRHREFHVYLGTVSAAFFACLTIYLFFPVAGPFYSFTPPDPRAMGQFMPPLVHWVLRHGSSVGTAFPSSHVAVAVTVLMMAWTYSRKAFWVLLAFVPALAVGAVYGGFHYAIDTLAGAALGLVVWRFVPGWISSSLPEA